MKKLPPQLSFEQAEVPFKIEKNETWGTWYITEFPDEPEFLNIRSPFDTKEEALQRELDEELGVRATEVYPWLVRTFDYPEKTV